MTWSRQKSDLETLMIQVLKLQKRALSLSEIVIEIEKISPYAFSGNTPTNSLYSIIYRREKRRSTKGQPPLFLIEKYRYYSVYTLNPDCEEML